MPKCNCSPVQLAENPATMTRAATRGATPRNATIPRDCDETTEPKKKRKRKGSGAFVAERAVAPLWFHRQLAIRLSARE